MNNNGKRAIANKIRKISVFIGLILISVLLLLPVYYLLMTSFKSFEESIGPFKWLPARFIASNYSEVFSMEDLHLFQYFLNTMYIFVMKTAGALFTCSIAAYGFVRYNYKYRELVFAVLMSVLILPEELLSIPFYEVFIKLGWMDSFKPLYIGAFFATDVFAVFLFRQFFKSVPVSLFEAGRMDGCGEFKMFLQIMIPLSKPVFITMFLLYFTGTYNDIYKPSMYLLSENKYTLAQGINMLQTMYDTGSRDYIVPWNLVSAATIISLVPVLAVFFGGQRYFVEGISTAGIKG